MAHALVNRAALPLALRQHFNPLVSADLELDHARTIDHYPWLPDVKGLTPTTTGPVIAIVGAGASADVGLPSSADLKRMIVKAVTDPEFPHHISVGTLESAIRENTDHTQTNVATATLEEVAQAACRYPSVRQRVVELVQRECTFEAIGSGEMTLPPITAYEVLSHLVKHGFIDHIISFNYDELLDDALQNELGTEALRRIISDRDLYDSDNFQGFAACLVKPHGSVGSRTSLRFMQDEVRRMDHGISDFIRRHILPCADHSVCTDSGPHLIGNPATLIVIGSAMRDRDFQGVLKDAAIDAVYRIDLVRPSATGDGPVPTPTRPDVSERWIAPRTPNDDSMVLSDGSLLGGLFIDLWDHIEVVAAEAGVSTVPASRHLALPLVFRHYLARREQIPGLAREQAEILLAAAKLKGRVLPENLVGTWRTRRHRAGVDALLSLESVKPQDAGSPRGKATDERARRSGARAFVVTKPDEAISELTRLGGVARRPKRESEGIRHHYRNILRHAEGIEVSRQRDPMARWQFPAAMPIYTLSELHRWTEDILRDERTERVAIVSSSAHWLASDWVERALKAPRQQEVKFQLIMELLEERPPLAGAYRKGGEDRLPDYVKWDSPNDGGPPALMRLHWWQREDHVTVALKREGDELIPFRGIHFGSLLRGSIAAPIYTANLDDARTLHTIFQRYRRQCVENLVWIEPIGDPSAVATFLTAAYDGRSTSFDGNERGEENIRRLIDTGRIYLAAFEGGPGSTVRGILSYQPDATRGAEFRLLGVAPGWRQLGVGQLLTRAMERRVRTAGRRGTTISVRVRAGATDHIAYLERLGYRALRGSANGQRILRKTLSQLT